MRTLYIALASLLASGAASAQDALKTPWFPLKVGSKWTYKAPKAEKADDTIVVEVKGMDKAGKEEVYELITSRNGTPEASEHVSVRADGVYRVKVLGKEVKPSLCFLKLPAKKGESWDVKSTLGPMEDLSGKFTIDEEEVEWDKKKVKATKVKGTDLSAGGQKMTLTYWFVEGVGLYKQSATFAGQPVTLELQKYEPAK